MQGLTPYNHNLKSYGENENGYGDSPRFVFRKSERRFYFKKIAVFIIIICLIAAAGIWYFNRTPGNLILKDYSLYFAGTLSDNKAEDSGLISFDLYDNEFLTCISDSNIYLRYFISDRVYFTLHEAENDMEAARQNGDSRNILIFSAKDIRLTADKDNEINLRVTQSYNKAYGDLRLISNLHSDAAQKTISRAMFEYRAGMINTGITNQINAIIAENSTLSAALTYFYTLTLNDVSKAAQHYFDPYFLNSLTLKVTYNFYLTAKAINRVK